MGQTLDLSQVFDRDEVKLGNGAIYQIRNPEEFGILEDHQLSALLKRIDAARDSAAKDDATEDDARAAKDLLRELATLLLIDLPSETVIGDWESVAIFEFHTKKRVARARKIAEEAGIDLPPPGKPRATRKSRTSARSSHGSKRSTAARRKTG